MKKSAHHPRWPEPSKELWLTVGMALLLACYRVVVNARYLQGVGPGGGAPSAAATGLLNGLFFLLLLLLWVSYRHWRSAKRRAAELDAIVTSIGPDVLIVIDTTRTITFCNDAVTRMYGYEPAEVLGAQTDLLYFDRRVDRHRHEVRDDLDKKGFHVGRAQARRKSGEVFPIEVITATLQASPGAVLLLRDITDRERLEERLVRQSTHDQLTGLLNRRGFFEAAAQQLKVCRRYGMDILILFIDMDGFKTINDTHGHQAGDQALVAMAEILREHLREADIIARLGGDEFAVLGVAANRDDDVLTAARIAKEIARHRMPGDAFRISASVGALRAPHVELETETLDGLLMRADERMYAEKVRRSTMDDPPVEHQDSDADEHAS